MNLMYRYLRTGVRLRSLAVDFRVHRSTCAIIVRQVASSIDKCCKPHFVRLPQTQDEWKVVADRFWTRWQYPYCLGAIDGKHCRTANFHNEGSNYYNFKVQTCRYCYHNFIREQWLFPSLHCEKLEGVNY